MATYTSHKPTSPGEILHLEFLEPLGITQSDLAQHIGVERKAINRLVNGRTSVTPAMAVALGGAFKMTPQFWLNLQSACDLHEALEAKTAPPPLAARSSKTMADYQMMANFGKFLSEV